MRTVVKPWAMVLALAACQPNIDVEDEAGELERAWMLGTWSSVGGSPNLSATYLEFHEDGVLLKTGLNSCGRGERAPREYRWTSAGPDSVEVTDLDGSPMDYWDGPVSFTFRDVCDERGTYEYLDVLRVRSDGSEHRYDRAYTRGRVCLHELPPPDDPNGFEWDDCRSEWCEGEPPATLPCLP